jgi:hypothetical protein
MAAAGGAGRTSVRCFGETKFFRQCPRYVVVDAACATGANANAQRPCFCWEHTHQTALRLEEVAVQQQHLTEPAEWAPLGAYLTNVGYFAGRDPEEARAALAAETYGDPGRNVSVREPHVPGEEVERSGTERGEGTQSMLSAQPGRLADLAADAQNVHTAEVQVGVSAAVARLRMWAETRSVSVERDLASRVAESLGWAPTDIQIGALQHLQHCYQWSDDTVMFNTTYPQLASWVWARVNAGGENAELLRERFFEEVHESRGQCLNGNMARLMNVFAAIDLEMSPQRDLDDVMTAQELQARVFAATRHQPLDAALAEVEDLLRRAHVTGPAREAWLSAVRDVYAEEPT